MARERSGEPVRPRPRRSRLRLSVAELRQLIALMRKNDIEELTVERAADALWLRLRRPSAAAAEVMSDAVIGATAEVVLEVPPSEEREPTIAEPLSDERFPPVTAPLVGRFHLWLKPGGDPLVAPGDFVAAGQVVGTIETLNVLNEVEASLAGRVVTIPIHEGDAVEFGTVLMRIDPEATPEQVSAGADARRADARRADARQGAR